MSPDALHRIEVANATHRMGFTALAAGMAAFCAEEIGHQFPLAALKVCPVLLPEKSGSGAVRGEAFSCNHTMNTVTTSPAEAGIFARKVAQVTGLSEMALDRLHTSDMGAPGHFLHLPGAGGGWFYTVAGLSRLVEILFAAGCKAEATMLRRALDEVRRPPELPAAPRGRNVRGGWVAAHGARQEEAA